MSLDETNDVSLRQLQAQLVQFVLDEVEAKLSDNQKSPLSSALLDAVEKRVADAVKKQVQSLSAPDAQDFADVFMKAVRNDLVHALKSAAKDAATEDPFSPKALKARTARVALQTEDGGAGGRNKRYVLIALGALLGMTLFAVGWLGGLLTSPLVQGRAAAAASQPAIKVAPRFAPEREVEISVDPAPAQSPNPR